MTKAAQIHLVKGLALLAAPKIRVNSVAPGLLLTEWGLKFPQKKIDSHIAKTKLGKVATAEVCCYEIGKIYRTGLNSSIGRRRAGSLFCKESHGDWSKCCDRRRIYGLDVRYTYF